MPTHLLDTSVYCQPLKPKPLPTVEQRWQQLGDEALSLSVICEAELLYGLELKGSTRLNSLYESLLKDRLQILTVDAIVAKTFSQLKATSQKKGISNSDFDLLIAATAKAHGLILATLNVRHFRQLEGVAIEDWSSSK